MKSVLKDVIKKNKKTQKEVAEQVGISEQYLSDMLCGKREINYKTVYKIGVFFEVDLDLIYYCYKTNKIDEEIKLTKNSEG